MADANRAVVWDLDGVIVDSGAVHNYSWTAMAKEFGVPYDPDKDFPLIFGKHNTDIISGQWGVSNHSQIDKMALRKETLFREAASALKPLPGVVDLIKALQAAGWKQGIGSSAPMDNISLLLKVTGLADYMQAIASGEDVTKGKPDPTVFLIAFRRLGVEPKNGVVIEDAPAGVQAANAAGAASLAVTNTQTEETLRKAGADLVVHTLEEMTVEQLEKMVEGNSRS